jgi:hypothetical protein
MLWHGKQMYRRLSEEVCAAGVSTGAPETPLVTQEDLVGLPVTAQHYLHAMGAVNRPHVWSFQAHFIGRFRLRGQGSWLPAEGWQYNSSVQVCRVFQMRADFAGVVPMVGRDTYVGGKGSMHSKLLGLFTLVHTQGPKTDMSELVTYLNDAVLMAPSMLLRPNISFAGVDDHSFDLTLVDLDQSVTARVLLDEEFRPVNFITSDRCADVPRGLDGAKWTTPIDGWQLDGDRFTLTRGSAVWQMPDGPSSYLDFAFSPGDVRYNIAPADIARRPRETGWGRRRAKEQRGAATSV